MIKSSYNQIANAKNPYQGKAEKVLCVCSAGLLRSPTIAHVLALKGYNTRAAGASDEYALIPLSTALVLWADKIVVVAEQHEAIRVAMAEAGVTTTPVTVLDIPDNYERMDTELVKIVEENLSEW